MNTTEITTTDLSKFGYREWHLLRQLIDAKIDQGLPKDFDEDEVQPMFNMNSGHVFLTNASYQVAMMNDDKLESFYSCPICGHEGFFEDMEHNEDDEECQEYLKEIAANQ